MGALMLRGLIVQRQHTELNMLVKMISRFAGENGTANPGDEIEVTKQQADDLIAGGFATPVKQIEIEMAVIQEPENAAITQQKPKGKK